MHNLTAWERVTEPITKTHYYRCYCTDIGCYIGWIKFNEK